MKILIVTHTSNDIFIFHFVKWIKTFQPEWELDIFEFFSNTKQGYDSRLYSNVTTLPVSTNKLLRFQPPRFFSPLYVKYHLKKYLKDKHYNIIQCHWITAPIVYSSFIKQYCDKLYLTFWGGELSDRKMKFTRVFHSKHIYFFYLKKMLKVSDGIINSEFFKKEFQERYPLIPINIYIASFGSSPLEELYKLMDVETKELSKLNLGFLSKKKTVMIGYSGKALHQHIPIIQELKKSEILKNKIHIIAPMTRDAIESYVEKVKMYLDNSGFSYTLITGKFMSNEEIARLRNATDVTLQLSEFDGYSRSIVECLCAKSIVLYGSWLKSYKERIEQDGFFAIAVPSIAEAIKQLEKIIVTYDTFREKQERNFFMGKDKNLWSICIKDWIDIYSK